MFFPQGQVRVFVYGAPVNLRLSFDGLYALTKNQLGQDPRSGDLDAYINRRATQIKVLYFDRQDDACGACDSNRADCSATGARCARARWTGRN